MREGRMTTWKNLTTAYFNERLRNKNLNLRQIKRVKTNRNQGKCERKSRIEEKK